MTINGGAASNSFRREAGRSAPARLVDRLRRPASSTSRGLADSGDGYAGGDPVPRAVTAEHALTRSEERFRSVIEQSADAIFVVDEQGVVVEANAAGAALLGYAIEELIGRSWADLVAPEDLAAQPLRFHELRAG